MVGEAASMRSDILRVKFYWPVRLRNPFENENSVGTVWLRDQGLGTSAATYQFFEYKGRKLGHLLDPRTGWPASGISSASVIAVTAAEADAMSTAAFVLGSTRTEELVRLKPTISAVLLEDREQLNSTEDKTVSGNIFAFNLAPNLYSPPVHSDRVTVSRRIDS